MNEKLIKEFKKVRDIPYYIPLNVNENDLCCSGKSRILAKKFNALGYKTRYRVCSFRWNSLNIPKDIISVPHENQCTHVFLEIILENKWVIIDATWDKGLSQIFHINNWNGKSNTKVAVPVLEIYSPEKSEEIMKNENTDIIEKDLKINGEFYKSFNNYLNFIRNKQ